MYENLIFNMSLKQVDLLAFCPQVLIIEKIYNLSHNLNIKIKNVKLFKNQKKNSINFFQPSL